VNYGGLITANWESASLRQYSSLGGEVLAELAQDPVWSNEGLFALSQGLRLLKQIAGVCTRLCDAGRGLWTILLCDAAQEFQRISRAWGGLTVAAPLGDVN
jgi:hypothetical protein